MFGLFFSLFPRKCNSVVSLCFSFELFTTQRTGSCRFSTNFFPNFYFFQNKKFLLQYHFWAPCLFHTQGESTPSAAFDVDASYPWNPLGDGLLMEAFDFPVVLVTAGSAAEVLARAVSNGPLGKRQTGNQPLSALGKPKILHAACCPSAQAIIAVFSYKLQVPFL